MMALSGVRSSWVMLFMNRILAWLARLRLLLGKAKLFHPVHLAKPGLDGRQQHLEIDRLGQVVVGPQPLAGDDVLAIGAGRDEDEGGIGFLRMVLAQLGQQLVSVLLGHGDVAEHEIRVMLQDRLHALIAIGRLDRLIAGIGQLRDNALADAGLILDAQDLCHRPILPLRWRASIGAGRVDSAGARSMVSIRRSRSIGLVR